MPSNFETLVFRMSEHFSSALINGDETGLTEEESEMFSAFIDELLEPGYFGHFSIDPQESEFALCEVTNLMANCFTVFFHYRDLSHTGLDA